MVAFLEVEKAVGSVARAHGWSWQHGVTGLPCNRCFKVVVDAFIRVVPGGAQIGCPGCIKEAYKKDIRYWKGEMR